MTVTNQESVQYANAFTDEPREMNPASMWGGNLKVMFFDHTQDGAGEATSDVKLVKLPPGRVRVLWDLSSAYVDWTTGSATMDIGWDAYTKLDGSTQDADPNGILDGLDVDSAGYQSLRGALTAATGGTTEFVSKDGVTIIATSQDVALAASSTIRGFIVYVSD